MNEKQMQAIWDRHNNSECDCTDGDYGHSEPECYVAYGYLMGLEQSEILERGLQSIATNTCCSGCLEARKVAERCLQEYRNK